ncbi:hypothetical protein DTO195F2_6101 [Paecilomyces variotii]|nr:hypothetical protein DTO195F2_6101 [Paecilomyces variotii]
MCSLVKWSFDTNVFGLSVEYQEGGILRANTSLEPKAFEEHVYQKLGIKIAVRRYVETTYGAFHFLWTMGEQMVNQKLDCFFHFADTILGSMATKASHIIPQRRGPNAAAHFINKLLDEIYEDTYWGQHDLKQSLNEPPNVLRDADIEEDDCYEEFRNYLSRFDYRHWARVLQECAKTIRRIETYACSFFPQVQTTNQAT